MADDDNQRYWVLDSETPVNRLAEVRAAAAPMPIVGLVDEEAGGVIAYVESSLVDELAARLNEPTLNASQWATVVGTLRVLHSPDLSQLADQIERQGAHGGADE